MFYYYDLQYLFYLMPVLVISIYAQIKVKSAYNKYSKIRTSKGFTGREAARTILDRNGCADVEIGRVAGELTDHFDPRTNVINLSTNVYDSSSVAAVGIAAHEAGHAVQHRTGYAFIKLRTAIIPICNLGSSVAPILILLGVMLGSLQLYWLGIIAFASIAVFQLVTLPVEFNASRRAIAILETNGTLNYEELKGAKKVLSAAALTYVAALLTSLMQLLYFISRVNRNGNNR